MTGITEEDKVSLGEIMKMVGKLKNRKALGEDGIPNEVWKYGGEGVLRELWWIIQKPQE